MINSFISFGHSRHKIAIYLYLITISMLILVPLMWVISTSLRLPVESYSLPPKWLPTDFRWENYYEVMFSYYLEKKGIFVGTQASAKNAAPKHPGERAAVARADVVQPPSVSINI